MQLGEIYGLGEFLKSDVEFIAVWKDNFHEDDSHDGESAGFADPRTAFALAAEKANELGFMGTTYAVEAMIGDDVRIVYIDDYFGTIQQASNY